MMLTMIINCFANMYNTLRKCIIGANDIEYYEVQSKYLNLEVQSKCEIVQKPINLKKNKKYIIGLLTVYQLKYLTNDDFIYNWRKQLYENTLNHIKTDPLYNTDINQFMAKVDLDNLKEKAFITIDNSINRYKNKLKNSKYKTIKFIQIDCSSVSNDNFICMFKQLTNNKHTYYVVINNFIHESEVHSILINNDSDIKISPHTKNRQKKHKRYIRMLNSITTNEINNISIINLPFVFVNYILTNIEIGVAKSFNGRIPENPKNDKSIGSRQEMNDDAQLMILNILKSSYDNKKFKWVFITNDKKLCDKCNNENIDILSA